MTTPKRAMHCSNDISITSLRADSICMVSICTEGHSPSVAKLRGLTAYRCGSTEFIVAHTLFIVQYCFTRLSTLILQILICRIILSTINGDMGVPFQARSRYFSRLAVLKLS